MIGYEILVIGIDGLGEPINEVYSLYAETSAQAIKMLGEMLEQPRLSIEINKMIIKRKVV